MRIARGGLSWIFSSAIIALLLLCVSVLLHGIAQVLSLVLFILILLVSCLLIIFFRDPERSVGTGVVAVADGRIREVLVLHDPDVGETTRISTFMNIHNVHVNRMPLSGTVTSLIHHKGGHLPAFQKESEHNERVVLLIRTSIGTVKIVQIAGALARRIVPYVKQGDTLEKGARLGLIRLGSRVDVYLPTKQIKALSIHVHDRMKAGEGTLAELNA